MLKPSTRRFAATAACAALVGLTAACGGSSSSKAGGTVTLTYMIWQDSEKAAYQASLNEFEKAHPNIKVNLELVAWAQYWTKLQTGAASRNMPDVFWDHLAYLPQLAKEGIITDISSKIKAANLDTSIYSPKLLSQWQSGNVTYGLPKDWDTIATIYNKSMLAKAGLTADQMNHLTWDPTTGGSFVAALQKLTVDVNGKHPNQAGFDAKHVKTYGIALEAPNGQQDWWDFGLENGCQLQDKPYGKWTVNTPACVQAIQFEQDLRDKWHVAAPGSMTNTPNAADLPTILAKGDAATTFDGDWDLTAFQSAMPAGSWGVSSLPSGPAGTGTVFNGLSDAIYAHTKHPAEAWELEQWLASTASEKLVADSGTVWPGIPTLNSGFAAAWKAKGVDVTAFQTGSEGNTMGYPLTTSNTTFNNIVLQDFNQVWLGQMTPQAAADDVNTKSNAAITSGN